MTAQRTDAARCPSYKKHGRGVSTEGAPLTRVKCKNNLGVLFDPEAEEAFRAAATGPEGVETVPWLKADAYGQNARDGAGATRKHVLFPRT